MYSPSFIMAAMPHAAWSCRQDGAHRLLMKMCLICVTRFLHYQFRGRWAFPLRGCNAVGTTSSSPFYLLSCPPNMSNAPVSMAVRGFNPVSAWNANYRVNPSEAINTHSFTSRIWGGEVAFMMNWWLQPSSALWWLFNLSLITVT